MAKDIAIVLNNGSINSAVVTALAAQKYRPVLLSVDSDDDAGGRRRAALEQQLAHFKPYRQYIVSLSLPSGPAPKAATAAADPRQLAPLGPQMLDLLPIISIGARLAALHEATAIYIGTRIGPATDDLAQATEYFQIWTELLHHPCGQKEVELATPLLELEPWQVVDVGFQVSAPFERTWSCLEDTGDPCWACRGCRSREVAFQQAGKPDPLRVIRKV